MNCPCPNPGDRHCECSRNYTRQLALWTWERLCAFVRSLDLADWLAVGMVALAIAATVAGK